MAHRYFFTGYPGFIATGLMKRLIQCRDDVEKIYLLVLPAMVDKAEQELQKIVSEVNGSPDIFTILPGDITKENLDIASEMNSELQQSVTHVFHLAAIYDLAVPKHIAFDVNVNGTKFVNNWLRTLSNLQRYVYFSTAYVSGTREGRILETELEMGQSFKNHYETTKYQAEVLVRKVMDQVPVTIIRPGIVMGNSKTGETIKFDGPYFMLNFFDRLKFIPVIPYLGLGKAEGNFVPVDYVIDATIYLSHTNAGMGKTYHLTNPNSYSMKEVYQMMMKEYLGKSPAGFIPLSLAKLFLSFSWFRKWVRVEKEALEYFTCKAVYDSAQAQKDLEGSGISCPDFKKCVKPIVDFYAKNKDHPDKHVVIH